MATLTHSLKELVGSTIYDKALDAYKDSNAAKTSDLLTGLTLPQAAYALLTITEEVLQNREATLETEEILELSHVIYGLLILREKEDVDQDLNNLVVKAMKMISQNLETFTLDDGNTFDIRQAVYEILVFLGVKKNRGFGTTP